MQLFRRSPDPAAAAGAGAGLAARARPQRITLPADAASSPPAEHAAERAGAAQAQGRATPQRRRSAAGSTVSAGSPARRPGSLNGGSLASAAAELRRENAADEVDDVRVQHKQQRRRGSFSSSEKTPRTEDSRSDRHTTPDGKPPPDSNDTLCNENGVYPDRIDSKMHRRQSSTRAITELARESSLIDMLPGSPKSHPTSPRTQATASTSGGLLTPGVMEGVRYKVAGGSAAAARKSKKSRDEGKIANAMTMSRMLDMLETDETNESPLTPHGARNSSTTDSPGQSTPAGSMSRTASVITPQTSLSGGSPRKHCSTTIPKASTPGNAPPRAARGVLLLPEDEPPLSGLSISTPPGPTKVDY